MAGALGTVFGTSRLATKILGNRLRAAAGPPTDLAVFTNSGASFRLASSGSKIIITIDQGPFMSSAPISRCLLFPLPTQWLSISAGYRGHLVLPHAFHTSKVRWCTVSCALDVFLRYYRGLRFSIIVISKTPILEERHFLTISDGWLVLFPAIKQLLSVRTPPCGFSEGFGSPKRHRFFLYFRELRNTTQKTTRGCELTFL